MIPVYLAMLGAPDGTKHLSVYLMGIPKQLPHRCSRDAQHTIPEINAKVFEEGCRRQPLSK
jgi:hypothetical protein